MSFDDQLRRASDTLSDRMRDEIQRQISSALDELAESARKERDAAVAAVEEARDKAIAAAKADSEAAVAAAHADRDAALASVEAERDAAVLAAQQDRDEAIASAQADRDAAVAAAQAERDAALGAATAAAVVEPQQPATDEVLRQVAAAVRDMSQASSLTGVLQALMTGAGASGAMANVWLMRGGRLEPWRHDNPAAPLDAVALDADNPVAEAARTGVAARRDEVLALPLLLAGEVVGVLVTASPQSHPDSDAPEVLALYASRALEAITAFKTARALTRQPDALGGADTDQAPPGAVSAEETASAQRYAKLLVSEIKLYHEADVVSGQRDRDLMSRLGGEIAHARVMYEQRVPPHVRRQADYFHDELVRTLANGDPALLEVRS